MATTAEDLLIRIDATTETLRRELTRADQSVAGFAQSVDKSVDRVRARLEMIAQTTRSVAGRINANLRVSDDFGGKDRARDIEAYGQKLDALRAKYSPLFAAQQRYLGDLREINQANKIGALSESERAAAVERLKAAFARQISVMRGVNAAAAGAAGSFGLASYQVGALGQQIQDVGVSLAGGQNPFLVIVQQAPQAAYAVGGFAELWRVTEDAIVAAAKAMLTLRGALIATGIGAVAAAFGALIAHLAAASAEAKAFSDRMGEIDKSIDAVIDRIDKLRQAYAEADIFQRRALDVRLADRFGDSLKDQVQVVKDFSGGLEDLYKSGQKAFGRGIGGGLLSIDAAKFRKSFEDAFATGGIAGLDAWRRGQDDAFQGNERLSQSFDKLRGTLSSNQEVAEKYAASMRYLHGIASSADLVLLGLTKSAYELKVEFDQSSASFNEWLATAEAGQSTLAEYRARLDGIVTGQEAVAIAQARVRDAADEYTEALRGNSDQVITSARENLKAAAAQEAVAERVEAAAHKIAEATRGMALGLFLSEAGLAAISRGLDEDFAKKADARVKEAEALADRLFAKRGAGNSGGASKPAAGTAQSDQLGENTRRLSDMLSEIDQSAGEQAAAKYTRQISDLNEMLAKGNGTLAERADALRVITQAEAAAEQAAGRATAAIREQAELRAMDRRAEIAEANGAPEVAENLRREIAFREERNRLMAEATSLYGSERAARDEYIRRGMENYQRYYDIVKATDPAKKALQTLEEFSSRAFDRIGSAITEAFVQGKLSLQDLGNVGRAVISELIQMMIQLAVINPIKNSLGGGGDLLPTLASVIGGLGGGGGGFSGLFAGGGGSFLEAGAVTGGSVMVAHTGALVGSDMPSSRTVDMSIFDAAPRMHTGGIAGDEMPAILQKGELVVPRDRVAQAMGGSSQNITFNSNLTVGQGVSQAQVQAALDQRDRQWRQQLGRNIGGIIDQNRRYRG